MSIRSALLILIAATLSSVSGAAAQVQVAHFAGDVRATTADGTRLPVMRSLVRRTSRPDDGVVIDSVLDHDPAGQGPPVQYTITYAMTGRDFTLSEAGRAFTGTGSVTGEPFDWTTWTAEMRLADGSRAHSEGRRTAAGSLVMSRSLTDTAGRVLGRSEETLVAVTQEAWLAEYTKALGRVHAAAQRLAALERTDHFRGHARLALGDGGREHEFEILASREYRPLSGEAGFHTITVDPSGVAPTEHATIEIKVDKGDTFTIADRGRAFRGEGAFSGPTWEWNGFESTTRLADGSRVKNVERTIDGRLDAETVGTTAGGSVFYSSKQSLSPISRDDYAARLAALFPGRKPGVQTETVLHFAGTTTARKDDAKDGVTSDLLLQVTFDPRSGIVRHHTIAVDPAGKARPMQLILVFRVAKDSTFTIEAAADAATGTGRLFGPVWAWTRIDRDMKLPDGTRLVSSESLLADGRLVGTRRLETPDGAVAFRFEDDLRAVSGDEWLARVTQANYSK